MTQPQRTSHDRSAPATGPASRYLRTAGVAVKLQLAPPVGGTTMARSIIVGSTLTLAFALAAASFGGCAGDSTPGSGLQFIRFGRLVGLVGASTGGAGSSSTSSGGGDSRGEREPAGSMARRRSISRARAAGLRQAAHDRRRHPTAAASLRRPAASGNVRAAVAASATCHPSTCRTWAAGSAPAAGAPTLGRKWPASRRRAAST